MAMIRLVMNHALIEGLTIRIVTDGTENAGWTFANQNGWEVPMIETLAELGPDDRVLLAPNARHDAIIKYARVTRSGFRDWNKQICLAQLLLVTLRIN